MAKKRLNVKIDGKAHHIIEKCKANRQFRDKDETVEYIILEWEKIKNDKN